MSVRFVEVPKNYNLFQNRKKDERSIKNDS